MSRPTKCISAVQAMLMAGPVTTRQLVAATGFSRSSVETALAQLRREQLPECDNLLREKGGSPPIGSVPVNRGKDRYAERETIGNPDTSWLLASALSTRTPLERAWGAQA